MLNKNLTIYIKLKVCEILENLYANDIAFPYSCDIATKMLISLIETNKEFDEYKIFYVRGTHTFQSIEVEHSYLEFHKDNSIMIIDPTSYQFKGEMFAMWEYEYYKMGRTELLLKLNRMNDIFVTQKLSRYNSSEMFLITQ